MKKSLLFIVLILALFIVSRSYSFAKYEYGVSDEIKISTEKFYANGSILYDSYVKEDDESLVTDISLNNYVTNDYNDLDTVFEVSITSDIYNLKIGDQVAEDGKMTVTIDGKAKNSKTFNLSLIQKEGTSFEDRTYVDLVIKTISPYEKTVLSKKIAIIDEKNLSEHVILKRLVWQSGLSGDGYRYTGLNPDNYVCFGTDSKSDCINNPDVYMYRIIGVFYDKDGVKHTKLIKYKQLKSKSLWFNSDSTATWGTSVLKDNINGAHFLTNTSTYPYLAVDTKWYKAIMLWNYSGLIRASSSDVFLNTFEEEKKAAKYSYKIGLMYLTDIGLGLGKSGLNVKVWRNSENPLINSWLHQKNNDISVSNIEWTMSIYCNGCTHFYANGITAAGTVDAIRYEVTPYSSRPVFYLIDEMEYVSGTGTIGNPYIITNNNI